MATEPLQTVLVGTLTREPVLDRASRRTPAAGASATVSTAGLFIRIDRSTVERFGPAAIEVRVRGDVAERAVQRLRVGDVLVVAGRVHRFEVRSAGGPSSREVFLADTVAKSLEPRRHHEGEPA